MEYPKYNGEKLDQISRKKFDRIFESILLGYFVMGGKELEGITNENKKIIAYNIAFLLVTDLK